jgi:hypothetical protein
VFICGSSRSGQNTVKTNATPIPMPTSTNLSVQYLPVTLAMRMSVIPEQTRRMIARNLNRVMQNLARAGEHCENVILRGVRRDGKPVKMQVRRIHARIHRTRLVGLRRKIVDVGDFENVTGGSADHRSYRITVESEGIPAIFVHCVERDRHNVILCSHLRGLWQGDRLGAA